MSQSELVKQLQQLSELHSQGAITDAEFAAAKQQLLNAGAAPAAPSRSAPDLQACPDPNARSEWARDASAHPAPEPQGPRTRVFGTDFAPPNQAGGSIGSLNRPGSVPAGWPSAQPAPARMARSSPAAESAPPNLSSRLAGHSGAVTSAVAGAVVLLSFLVLPMANVPFLGSISGSGVAGQSSLFGLFGLLWLVPVEALAIMGIAAVQIMMPATVGARRARSLVVIALAAGVWATYVVVLISLQAQISEISTRLSISAFLGAGLWLALVAAAVAAVGSLVEMTARA